MADSSGYSRGIKVTVLCILWFCLSSSNNVIIKRFLGRFPYPITVSLSHMTCTAFLMHPLLLICGVRTTIDISMVKFYLLLIPLGIGKLLVSTSAHVSIWRVPVSYAHTVKAMMPIFTVMISRLFFNETQSLMVYLSLVPIISGVAIATVTEVSFELFGMIMALLCTIVFALQNIYTKRAIKDLRLNHLHLLTRLAHISFVIAVPLWLFTDASQIANDSNLASQEDLLWFTMKLALSGFINFSQNIMAFSVLNLLSPLSYSVTTATKRVLVIAVSILTLKNPVTILNMTGMVLAVFGVFLYNRTKQIEARKRLAMLPFVYKQNEMAHLNGISKAYRRPQ